MEILKLKKFCTETFETVQIINMKRNLAPTEPLDFQK